MLVSPSTLEHLELIMGSVLLAIALMATVMTAVAALTYLVFREPARRAAAARSPVPAEAERKAA
jgi:peptidoglycan/LPS O-acetylase OafA/YrhL